MAIKIMTNIDVDGIRFTGPRAAEVSLRVGFRDDNLPEDGNGGSAVFTIPVAWQWEDTLDTLQARATESLMDFSGDLPLLFPDYTALSKT